MKIIVSDCFGVIVGEMIPAWLRTKFGIYSKSFKDKYCHDSDLGIFSFKDVVKMISNEFNVDENKTHKELIEIAKPNERLISYLRNSKHKVVLLSNASEGLVEEIMETYHLSDIFDKMFISYKYKIAKPNMDFYKMVMDEYGQDNEFVFMDDVEANLVPAKELGWKTIHFKNDEESFNLIEELVYEK